MAAPLVSVIVPTHDGLPLLARTLACVRAQTLKDVEIVLVDDGSGPRTAAWVRRQAGRGVVVLRCPRRRGTAAARNAGLAFASGRFVAFLDHDDVWSPRFLAALLPSLRRPGRVMAAANVDLIDGRGRVLRRRATGSGGGVDATLRKATGLRATPCMSACLFRRDALTRLRGLDEGFVTLDDLDLFHRVGRRYGARGIVFVDRVLGAYRLHRRQQTAVYGADRSPRAVLRGFLKDPGRDPRVRECLLDAAYFYAKHGRRLLAL